jgi:integrase
MSAIQAFLDEQTAKGLKDSTVKTYYKALKRLNAFKPVEEITKESLIQYFKLFECSDSTRLGHSVIIKKFFMDTGREEVASWIKPKRPYETIKSDDILNGEDVNKMLEATDSLYWKAMIAILFESGARIGEIQILKYKDFQDTKDGLIVHIPTSKTAAGFRKMILINSSQYLRNLKASVNGKPDNVVFTIGYRYTFEVIRDIGRAAGIKKHVSPHAFRHARATAAINDMPEAVIRKMLGWSPNSTMISRYQHLNDNSVIEAQLGHGGENKPVSLNPAEKVDLEPVYKKLTEENSDLKAQMENTQKEMESLRASFNEEQKGTGLVADFMELLKKEPRLLDILKEASNAGQGQEAKK